MVPCRVGALVSAEPLQGECLVGLQCVWRSKVALTRVRAPGVIMCDSPRLGCSVFAYVGGQIRVFEK